MEQGKIICMNERRGIFAVESEQGDFGVFEEVSWHGLKVGDSVAWSAREPGRTCLTNTTQANNSIHVYARGWVGTKTFAVGYVG